MKQLVRIALATLSICVAGFAAEQTWTGRISSNMCDAEKNAMSHECILNCIKAGAKYVFVVKGKSYDFRNQDFGDLEKHAGHTVRLTGDFGSDGHSIIVTKIEMAGTKAK